MTFKKDPITKLMNQHRFELPAQDSYDDRRKSMLEYITSFYDTHKNTENLVARLKHLECHQNTGYNIAAFLAGGFISFIIMYLISNFLVFWSMLKSYVFCFILIIAFFSFSASIFVFKNGINSDPYFTNEYEAKLIREILDEHIDEIAQMRLKLSFQNSKVIMLHK